MGGDLTPKEIVDNCRVVLMKNVVLTEELIEHLLKNNVLSDLSLKEIKAHASKESQNKTLLEQLSVKGRFIIERFAESLQICGFNFLSDMLRDQLTLKDAQFIDIADLHKRAPRVEKALDRREKDDLNTYLNQKVHEYSLKAGWQKDTVPDKEKALMAKQRQLEETWRYTELIEDKDNTIQQLSEQLEQAFNEADKKGVHLQNVSQYLNQLKQKHVDDMKIQMKYNQANDNSLRRQAQQHGDMEKELSVLIAQITETLRNGNQLPENTRRPSMMSDGEAMIVTAVDKLKYSLQKLLTHTQDLQSMKLHYDKLKEDCYYVLSHLGRDVDSDLRLSFQSFIVENEEITVALRNTIEVMKRELEQKELSMREQIDNSENKLRDLESQQEQLLSDGLQKDSHIKSLQIEIEKLKRTIAQLEKQLAGKMMNRRPSSPRFKDYNEIKTPEHQSNPTSSPRQLNKSPQHSIHLPSIHKKEYKARPKATYAVSNSEPTHHHHLATSKANNSFKTPASTFHSNPINPFIVQSLGGGANKADGGHHAKGPHLGGKAKIIGAHQNPYGKQQSVEVEMKKGMQYYR